MANVTQCNRDQLVQYLIELAAQIKLGYVWGVSVAATDTMGKSEGRVYLEGGVSKLELLDTQIRMLAE